MLSICEAFSIGIFNFSSQATLILVIAVVAVVVFVVVGIRNIVHNNPRKTVLIILAALLLMAAGAFMWRYIGPAVDKYLTHAVDQSINGDATDPAVVESNDEKPLEDDGKKGAADGQKTVIRKKYVGKSKK